MDIFASIIEWAKELPAWEQEAVRRLLMDGAITEEGEEEIIALIMAGKPGEMNPLEIPDPQPVGTTAVSLVSLEHVCGVNALAPKQRLDFNHPMGLTVIYGDNGSGKSGYSRIQKHACRFREPKPSTILADVFCDTTPPEAQAKFVYQEDGTEKKEDWKVAAAPSDALGTIALFDSHCCRLYVEEQGDLAYRPYGLEVLDQLGDICKSVKQKLLRESAAIQVLDLSDQFNHPTVINAVSTVLSDNSKKNLTELTNLSTVIDQDSERAKTLQAQITQLETNDPQKLAVSRRKLATRLEQMVQNINSAQLKTQELLAELPDSLEKRSETADLAMKASVLTFGEEPVTGVGSDQWKKMFEYARAFSTEVAYLNESFPYIGPDSKCVLCHQPLKDEAKERLARFANFIGSTAEEEARTADKHYQGQRSSIIDLADGIAKVDDALLEQVAEKSETATVELKAARSTFADLSKSAEKATSSKEWKALHVPQAITQELTTQVVKLRAEADELEKNSNTEGLTKLKQEMALLDDRIRLAKSSSTIIENATIAAKKRRLDSLANDINTTHITRKAGEITEKVITKEGSSLFRVGK